VIRLLPVVIELALLIYCLIDCIQTGDHEVRNLPRWTWIILIILMPLVGGLAWLIAGRPRRARHARDVPWPATATSGFPEHERPRPAPRGPDDDPDYLRELDRRRRREQQDRPQTDPQPEE
jgi:hypothetical protein